MILRRCPSRSLTLVGDRAQARHGVEESWQERLGRVGMDRVRIATLSLNYRTPSEIMAEAAPVIRAALRSEEHTSELQSRFDLVCRLLLEKKKKHYILH